MFGIAVGTCKCDNAVLRGAIGDLSAPWLVVGFLPALSCRNASPRRVHGFASTVALVGFYAALVLALTGHLGGGGHVREFLVEGGANRIYFLDGLVTGALLGAPGAWIGRRHPGMVTLAVGGVLAGEILAVALVQGHQLAPRPLHFRWGVDAWRPYIGECPLAVGVILATLARRRLRRAEVPADS